MAKFLNTVDLNAALFNLIKEAESEIVLISPFIKLHTSIHSVLETKKRRPDIKITIVFGKNKGNLSQSLGMDDLEFFKEFPNVEIYYLENLHAKYYANESAAILTSMNLYDFSQNNNIEFGILLKTNFLVDIAKSIITSDGSLDIQAYVYFKDYVIPNSKLLYQKVPQYDNGVIGTGIGKKYINSIVTTNKLDTFPSVEPTDKKSQKIVSQPVSGQQVITTPMNGYCIRTGAQIPFNPKRPMCDEAYKNWSRFSNPEYAEKFCHFSGESSDGETSFSKPILRKNWNKAKEIHGF